jgi:glycosyltransferase involved in cell wall biosynthesis
MINVLHLTASFGLSVGGAETNLLRLVCHMDRSRFRNTVVTMTDLIPQQRVPGLLQSRLAKAEIPLRSLGMRRGVPSPLAATRFFRIVRKVRPDILQTWMYHADLLGLLVGKLAGVSAIAWNIRCSSMEMAHYRLMSTMVLRALVRLSGLPHVVLANSQRGIQVHKELGYTPRRWLYIPNSLDLDEFRPDRCAKAQVRCELGLRQDTHLIGLMARFHPMKDHANFIAAANMLAADDPSLHFVLAGLGVDSNNGEVRRLVESTGLPHRFHLLGQRHDVGRITAALDIACSSSAFGEGSSNAVAEAMACGVPCVVTDVGDSAFIVQNTGKIVPPRDTSAFAQACRELLNLSPRKRRELGLAARARVEERFSLHSVVDSYQRLYEQLAPAGIRQRSLTQPSKFAGLR